MKKVILLSFIILHLFGFSQSSKKNEINWISLEKAEKYSKKYDQNILIFFYKPNCEFCDKMKQESLNNIEVINLINNNFLPVKINGYTKDTIVYNNKVYGNQQPASSGRNDWRHDFYFELGRYNDGIVTPTIVIMNKDEKVIQLTGLQTKPQLLRSIKKIIK